MAGGVISEVWLCQAVSNKWSEGVLLPLVKKRDQRTCSYYRGINLPRRFLVSLSSKDSSQKYPKMDPFAAQITMFKEFVKRGGHSSPRQSKNIFLLMMV